MENVVNDLVNFNLKIVQCNEYFNFSLDSVILANFVKILPSTKNIIDLGTGNAPIPLILSLKAKENVNIVGVELQKEVFNLAKETLKINKLDKRIKLLNSDVNDIFKVYNTDTFDIVVTNPPYFKLNEESILNDNIIKSVARHEIKMTIHDIARVSRKILKNKGRLYMIHRTDRFMEIVSIFKENNLEPKRVKFIYPKENSESNLFLIEAVKNGKSNLKVDDPLIVHKDNGEYSEKVLEMFGGSDDTKKL